jgi:hypothetical protein
VCFGLLVTGSEKLVDRNYVLNMSLRMRILLSSNTMDMRCFENKAYILFFVPSAPSLCNLAAHTRRTTTFLRRQTILSQGHSLTALSNLKVMHVSSTPVMLYPIPTHASLYSLNSKTMASIQTVIQIRS